MTFSLSSSSLSALSIISASISLLIASLYVFVYVKHVRSRSFSSQIMLNLAISDIGLSFSYYLIGDLCLVQAICQQFFSIASWCWMTVLAVHSLLVVDQSSRNDAFKFSRLYMYIAWILPMILTLIPLSSRTMGTTDLWCWISPDYAGHRYFGLYFPSIVAYLIIAYCYIVSTIHLRNASVCTRIANKSVSKPELDKQATGVVNDWILYLIVLALIRLPAVIHRSAEYFGEADAIWLLLHAMLAPLQPAVNSLLMWNKNRAVRRILIIQRKHMPSIVARLLSFGHEDSDFDPPFVPIRDAPSLRILSVPSDLDMPISSPLSPTPPVVHDPHSKHLRQAFSVFAGTWNMGNKRPSIDSLSEWIPCNEYDIYAIAVQEAHYFFDEKQKTLMGRMLHSRAHSGAHWRQTIMSTLSDRYTLVEYASLHHIRLIVAVRSSLMRGVSNITSHSAGAGLMKLHGNKGSVAITFSLDGLSFAFISNHLAAHANQFHSRAEDFVQSLFGCFENANIGAFNAVFVLGDLNYRLTASKHEITDWLVEKRYDILKESDELLALMRSNRLFYSLKEAVLMFPPTYKYLVPKRSVKRTLVVGDALTMSVKGEYDVIDIESNEPEVHRPRYDEQHETVSSRIGSNQSIDAPDEHESVIDARRRKTQQKYTLKRSPAWCDRILYHTSSHINIKQHEYTAIKTVKSSDHKPVRGVFTVGFAMPSLRKFKRVANRPIHPSINLHIHHYDDDDDDLISSGASDRSRSLERAKKLARVDPVVEYYRHIASHSYPSIHQSISQSSGQLPGMELEFVLTHLELYDCVSPYSFPLIHPYLTVSHTISHSHQSVNQSHVVYQSQVATRVNDRLHVPLRPHAPLLAVNAAMLAVSPTVSLPVTPPMNAMNDDMLNTPSLPASVLHSRSSSTDQSRITDQNRSINDIHSIDQNRLVDQNRLIASASRRVQIDVDSDTDSEMSAQIDRLLSENVESSNHSDQSISQSVNNRVSISSLPSSPYRTQHPSVHPSPRRWDSAAYDELEHHDLNADDPTSSIPSLDEESDGSDLPPRRPRRYQHSASQPTDQSKRRLPPPNHPPAPFIPQYASTSRMSLSFPALLPSPSNATSMVCSWSANQLPIVPIKMPEVQSISSPPALLSVARSSVVISVCDRAWLGDSSEFVGVANVELHLLMAGGESSFTVPVTWATRFNGYMRGRGVVRVKRSQRPVNITL